MGWPNDDEDDHHCPQCGEPHPHFRDGVCELCWYENEAAEQVIGDDKPGREKT